MKRTKSEELDAHLAVWPEENGLTVFTIWIGDDGDKDLAPSAKVLGIIGRDIYCDDLIDAFMETYRIGKKIPTGYYLVSVAAGFEDIASSKCTVVARESEEQRTERYRQRGVAK